MNKRKNIQIFKDTRFKSLNTYKTETDRLKTTNQTKVYYILDSDFKLKSTNTEQRIIVTSDDTVSSILKNCTAKQKVAALNFADPFIPGGLVKRGVFTQEGCLCRCSNLYESLTMDSCVNFYYKYNRKTKTNPINELIYSKNVMFFKDNNYLDLDRNIFVDIITCPAPIKCRDSEKIRRKIDFILYVAAQNKIDTLILGAWGCGAFLNNPYLIASIFKEELSHYKMFSNVIFAIKPNKQNNNYEIFKNIFFMEDKNE